MVYYPLTTPQQNIWNLQKYYEHTAIGNISGMITFAASLSHDMPALLDRAINRLIETSDSMRIRLVNDAGTIKQFFHEYVYENVEVRDYSAYSEQEFSKELQTEVETPLSLLNQPLYRFYIIKREEQYSVFMIIHHMICDGWTSNLLANRLAKYISEDTRTCDTAVPPYSYVNFIAEEEKYRDGCHIERDAAYWDTFAREYAGTSYIKPQMPGADSVDAAR